VPTARKKGRVVTARGDGSVPQPRPPSGLGPLAKALNLPFVAVIWAYRYTLSPIVGGQCRYEPTCSRYGLEAYRLHGPVRGTWLTARRIVRCNPFVRGGIDPVPPPPASGSPSAESPDAQTPRRPAA
jgi:putative membrane protein insertion efficiency factor